MSPLDIRAGVRRLFRLAIRRPRDAGADADQELASLLEEHVLYLTARGLDPAAARAEAVRRLGTEPGEARARLRHSALRRERRMLLREWLEDLGADLRYALRTLRRGPALAAAAIVTLALAIGANTAIFSAVSAVMLRPLPFAEPGRLVMVWEKNPDFQWYEQDAAPANYLDWREQVSAFAGAAAYPDFAGSTTLNGYGEPRLLDAADVTGGFFDVLGVRAHLGRTFREEETWDNSGPPGVVLSYRAWRDVFGADPALVGRSIQLGGQAIQVLGVLPESFAIPGLAVDLFRSVGWRPSDRNQVWFRRAHFVRVIARLRPGVTLASADAALQAVATRLEREYPATNTHMGAGLTPLHEFLVGKTRLPLLVMFGAVALLLLIACANVANLLLVKAAGREREAAVRLALGAGRGRLLRQALAESALLAILGGAAGVALGWWGTRILAALVPAGMLPVRDIAMSRPVLGYAALATGVAALVFGSAPAVWARRRVPADVLRGEGRAASGGLRARRWGEGLLVTQVAMALALTLGAGLLVRSYLLIQRVEAGFDPHGVLAVSIRLPGIRFDSVSKVFRFYQDLEQEARGLPGVESSALVSQVSLTSPSWSSTFSVAGEPPPPLGSEVVHREITAGYHQVMRVPLLRGRLLTPADRQGSPFAVLINETLARKYFAGRDPVGLRIAFDRIPDSNSVWRTIVGVVGDERQGGLAQPAKPEIFAPYQQEARNAMTLVVRTGGDPSAIVPGVRAIVRRLDPLLAVASIRTMEDVRAESLGRDRFLTVLMLSFAVVGFVLGIVGVYGVVAQLARRRMREMGIRMALGARTGQVQWLVVRHGVTLAAVGVAAGAGASLFGVRVIRTLLYGVAPTDPVTFLLVPALVLLTAALASWLPAVRAGRADPCQVLRAE